MLHWHRIHTSNWSSQFLSYICTIIPIKGKLSFCKIRRTASSKSLKYLSTYVASTRIHRCCSSNHAFWSNSFIIYPLFWAYLFLKGSRFTFPSLWPHSRGIIFSLKTYCALKPAWMFAWIPRLSLSPQWHCCWPKGAIRSHSPWVTPWKPRWLLTDELCSSCLFSKLTFVGKWSRIICILVPRVSVPYCAGLKKRATLERSVWGAILIGSLKTIQMAGSKSVLQYGGKYTKKRVQLLIQWWQ